MRKFRLFIAAGMLVFATTSVAYSASTSAAQTMVPPTNPVHNGTVANVNPNGTVVIVDNESGNVYVVTTSGLTFDLQAGDFVTLILIETPNGNFIVQRITKGNSNH